MKLEVPPEFIEARRRRDAEIAAAYALGIQHALAMMRRSLGRKAIDDLIKQTLREREM